MHVLLIDHQNIKDHPWVWDFLETERTQNGTLIWQTDEVFHYNNHQFKFGFHILARKRKEVGERYSYELFFQSNENIIGEGDYGSVYSVTCTVSLDKKGVFHIKNHDRIIKKQTQVNSVLEYQFNDKTPHLKMKAPSLGYLVMKRQPGETLDAFLYKHRNTMSMAKKLQLTQALLKTVQEQLILKRIAHNDLHNRNIMVHEKNDQFEMNIIDFGTAKSHSLGLSQKDANTLLYPILMIWKNHSRTVFDFILSQFNNQTVPLDFKRFEKVFNTLVPEKISQIERSLKLLQQFFNLLKENNESLNPDLQSQISKAESEKDLNSMTKLVVRACWVVLKQAQTECTQHKLLEGTITKAQYAVTQPLRAISNPIHSKNHAGFFKHLLSNSASKTGRHEWSRCPSSPTPS